MNNKVWYYARVSSKNQNLDRQIQQFKELGADDREIITEKKSGKDFETRETYQALKHQLLRNGDTLVICSLDRLGRNKKQIKEEIQFFKENNIRLRVLDIPTTNMEIDKGQEWIIEMVNNIIIEVLGSMAEQERENIKERQKQGILCARNKGVELGRPKAEKPAGFDLVIERIENGEITAVQGMKELGLTKTTFYKLRKGV